MLSDEDKDKIRQIYSELQGFLAQAPLADGSYLPINANFLGERIISLTQKLVEITKDDDYLNLGTKTVMDGDGRPRLPTLNYRSNLNALIMKLHGAFFLDEIAPFGGSPTTLVSQVQNNNQQVILQLGMDLKTAMDKATTREEKSFLKQITDKVSTVTTYGEFLILIANIAIANGITLQQILKLFGH